jgi:MFS family permease
MLNPSWERRKKSNNFLQDIRTNKNFYLYLIPWFMFSFANGAGLFLSEMVQPSEIESLAELIKYIGSSIFFIISGIISDYYGRKIALLIGFVSLGFSYSLWPFISISYIEIIASLFSGIAWASIMVAFLFTIVGDLSPKKEREIYFAISGILWMFIESSFAILSSLTEIMLPVTFVSSILSISMFLAVIPLIFAKETLPYDKMIDRRMSDYFEKVLKLLELED